MARRLFYILSLCILSILPSTAQSYFDAKGDSIDISLLTCSPGSEVWAQFGHTAIRVHNHTTGEDYAVNYGMFDMRQSFFIPKFTLGITDYEMGVMPMDYFLAEYSGERRGVTEQVLNLTHQDKKAIVEALKENAKPENVKYRYNYFYDNCTTRARDMIVSHLTGEVIYPKAEQNATYRSLLHVYNSKFKWSKLGDDLLLGVKADRPISGAQQQFLPNNLMNDFAKATYKGKPFVSSTNVLLATSPMDLTPGFFLSPMQCTIILFVVFIVVMALEYKKKRFFPIWNALVMLTTGVMGIIYFVMIFSSHPCVSINGLILIFNPINIICLYPAFKHAKRNEDYLWWNVWGGLIFLGLMFGFWQKYPYEAIIVALLLLSNIMLYNLIHKKISKKQ